MIRGSNPRLARDGKPVPPAGAALDIEIVKTPQHCPLMASVRLVYELRHITGNARSSIESEQEGRIEQHAIGWLPVQILSADEAIPASWRIYDMRRAPVDVKTPNGETLPLAFADYEMARDVARWMDMCQATGIGKSGIALTLVIKPIPTPYPLLIAEQLRDRPDQEELCTAIHLRGGT